jgi:dolichol-phosphate mannosyltransferase
VSMQDFDTSVFASRGWRVPAFRLLDIRPRRRRYALVVPTINEGERIRRQLRETFSLGLAEKVDVLIADGGSTDGSLDPDFLRSVDVRALLVKTGPGKLSAQLRCAYGFALLEGYDGIVTIDGNGKDSLDSVPCFVQALENGIDYAQASRFIRGGAGINTPLFRLLAIRLLHAPLLSLAARRWFTDTTQGFRAYSARYLLDERVQPFREVFSRYELLAYLTVRASQLGLRTAEVPTRRTYPRDEKTPTKISGLASHLDLVRVIWRTLRGHYAPPRV